MSTQTTLLLHPDHRAVLLRIDAGPLGLRGIGWLPERDLYGCWRLGTDHVNNAQGWRSERITRVVAELIGTGALERFETLTGEALQLTPIGQRLLEDA